MMEGKGGHTRITSRHCTSRTTTRRFEADATSKPSGEKTGEQALYLYDDEKSMMYQTLCVTRNSKESRAYSVRVSSSVGLSSHAAAKQLAAVQFRTW